MRRFSAHLIFTNVGPPLKNGIITTSDDGTVTDVEDTGSKFTEKPAVEFHDGIIIPGFINCHCHLELSHMKGSIPEGAGLGAFLTTIQKKRKSDPETILSSALSADIEMYKGGVDLCADISNGSLIFPVKKKSNIHYFNFLEVFTTDPALAERKMQEIEILATECERSGLPYSIVPHSVYTVSLPLFRLLKQRTSANHITSIHFMESEGEDSFLSDRSGPLIEAFSKAGLLTAGLQTPKSCISAIIDEVTPAGSLILVHNVFAGKEAVRKINTRGKVFWCLCPNSNLHIGNNIPPALMLSQEGCNIVIGTDSLASNKKLNVLSELKTLQHHFPSLSITDLIRWATINGAKALGKESKYGSIGPGKKSGLLLLENADLINMKLTPDTRVLRLI